MKSIKRKTMAAVITAGIMVLTTSLGHAAGGKVTSPTGTAPDRYVYYPGTEELAKESAPAPWSTSPR